MSKLTKVLALVSVLALLATACGGGTDTSEFGLIDDTKIIICTDSPYRPFEFQDDAGNFDGFDVDLMEEIAAGLDLDLEWVVTPFDGIWLQPAAGNCDLVVSAMTIKPDRAENALFSDPYFDSGQSLLVKQANQDLKLADMGGKVIGVQTGTTGEIYAESNKPADATLKSYDEPAAMFLALDAGEIDAILQDLPVNLDRTLEDSSVVISEAFEAEEQYGFASSLESTALIEAINDELQKVRDSGKYDEIYERWIGAAPGA